MTEFIYEQKHFKIELEYSLENAPILKIKKDYSDGMNEVHLHINNDDLNGIKDLILKAQDWRTIMEEKAKDESSIILEMSPPIEVVETHIMKKFKENKSYALLLWKNLMEAVDFRRDEDYGDEWKISWFDSLCEIKSNWEALESNREKPTNPTIINYNDDIYESETDFWTRVAEDSDMSLEEYFDSMD